jgi:hypothetical protein
MINYKGKKVFITGASRGIGKGLSKRFAGEGAYLALADLPAEKNQLEAWAEELRNTYGITVWTFYGDLTVPGEPQRLHAEVISVVGEIHTLVNNAGICWYGRTDDMPMERLERMILLNVLAYTKLSRLFLPAMIKRDEGAILNVSSGSCFQPVRMMTVYAATKAYTQSFTEGMRMELPRGSKIVIGAINPLFTRTDLMQDAGIPLDFIPVLTSYQHVDELMDGAFPAFLKGKPRYVPGWLNKFCHLGLVRYLPHDFSNKLVWILAHRLSEYLPETVVRPIMRLRTR